MSEYIVSRISPRDKRGLAQLDALLEKEGIRRDQNLDYTVGLFDEDYRLAATGSCFANTLRCLAVDSSHQGEGLLNQVISHLVQFQYERGNLDLFLYTKCNTAKFFGDLGFYEIARVPEHVVFMENRRTGFADYLKQLKAETAQTGTGDIGAVIMNANPFTLGHQYLLEQAASACSLLHVFVVSEDVSLVPYAVRRRLVEEGSAHLKNLVYHQTGSYMISNATFPSYFLKDSDTVIRSHACLDIQVFLKIAESLGITRRFVGEEPLSQVTGIYNQVMETELKKNGLTCTVIPRRTNGSGVISASFVRQAVHDGDWEAVRLAVPPSTFDYLTSPAAEPVISAIRASSQVIHY